MNRETTFTSTKLAKTRSMSTRVSTYHGGGTRGGGSPAVVRVLKALGGDVTEEKKAAIASPRPTMPKRRKTQERLRAFLFRLLFMPEAPDSPKRMSTMSIAQSPSGTNLKPLEKITLKSFIDDDKPSIPTHRPKLPKRHSTWRSCDDAESTSRSSVSSDSETSTVRNSLTSHDSGFFEALEYPASKLLSDFPNSHSQSPTRNNSSSTISYLPNELRISQEQQKVLLRCLQSLQKTLVKQEGLTSRFSTNLAHLFAIKERQIIYLKSVHDDAKERTIVALTRLRYLVGKAMVRKIVLGKRGLTILSFLDDHLSDCPEADFEDPPLLEMYTQYKIGLSNHRSGKSTLWDPKKVEATCAVLRKDLDILRALDEALREGILGPVRNFRYYKMAILERVQMKQFATFVEVSLSKFEVLYARWEKVLSMMDRVLSGGVR